MDVSKVLQTQTDDLTKVEKPIPISIDLQCLVAYDLNINSHELAATRDTCQLMINALFKQEIESNQDGVFAILPKSIKKVLPRQKPVPEQKHQTRWERFAEKKGIQKRKKTRVQYDESRDEYRPTFGYKNQGKTEKDLSDWIKEVDEEKPEQDQFQRDRELKKQRIGKNKMQQKRNFEESVAKKNNIDHKVMKKQVQKQILDTKISTASKGRFDSKLKNDNVKVKRGKQKYEDTMVSGEKEKMDNLKILERMNKPDKGVNSRKAINSLRTRK
jgi:regulator of ribosome biosynthesis